MFPFKPCVAVSPSALADYHLDRTAIHCALFIYSLGVFLYSQINSCPLLQIWFQIAITKTHRPMRIGLIHYPPHPLKAGYTTHSTITAPQSRFHPKSYLIPDVINLCRSTRLGLHGIGVNARMPLRIAPFP